MLTAEDWTQMAADVAEVVDANPIDIVIRRGTTTLAKQTVRIAHVNGQGFQVAGRASATQGTEESRGRVVLMGSTTLDIAVGDRFNDGEGVLYRVAIVRPNRRVGVMAEAVGVE